MKDGAIVFAGGGSGGHLFPGVAVADAIAQRCESLEIIFAGTRKEIERTILSEREFKYCSIDAVPSTQLKRNPVKFLWRYWQAHRKARAVLKQIRATAVVGLGGYASVPVVIAAHSLKIPTVLLEQNIGAGRANRWLSGRANLICHAFKDAVSSTPRARSDCVRVTGNPVRQEIADLCNPPRTTSEMPNRSTNSGKPMLLILGGSQGAAAVNEAVCGAIPNLAETLRRWRVVHQTGPRDVRKLQSAYSQFEIEHTVAGFFSNVVRHYQSADLVISRAGATSLAELACCGVPTVLIPIPDSLRNHQARNAEHYANANAAVVVQQHADSQRTASALSSQLARLMNDKYLRERMADRMRELAHPSAAEDVANLVLDCVGQTKTQEDEEIGRVRLPPNRGFNTEFTSTRGTAGATPSQFLKKQNETGTACDI